MTLITNPERQFLHNLTAKFQHASHYGAGSKHNALLKIAGLLIQEDIRRRQCPQMALANAMHTLHSVFSDKAELENIEAEAKNLIESVYPNSFMQMLEERQFFAPPGSGLFNLEAPSSLSWVS